MFGSEQERAVAAVREAEQSSTKIHMFERQTEQAEKQVRAKEVRIDELTEMIDSLRKQQVDQEKSHLRQIDALKKAKDEGNDEKSTSLQIKLNGKEAELERMENLLIEMHKKMDSVKEEQVAAEMECKEATKSQLRMEKDLEVVQQDAKTERKMWER